MTAFGGGEMCVSLSLISPTPPESAADSTDRSPVLERTLLLRTRVQDDQHPIDVRVGGQSSVEEGSSMSPRRTFASKTAGGDRTRTRRPGRRRRIAPPDR